MKINFRTTARDLELNYRREVVTYDLEESQSYQPGVLISIIHNLVAKLRREKSFSLVIATSNITEKEMVGNFYNFYQLLSIILFDTKNRIKFDRKIDIERLKERLKEKWLIQENLYTVGLSAKNLNSKEKNEFRNIQLVKQFQIYSKMLMTIKKMKPY
ncbi:MAG: hypothetical protein WBA74_05045 [Cyclobacteriaceae bacterium]